MKSLTIYFQESQQQVSTDEKNWVPISGYDNYNAPCFDLNENKDWCTVKTSKDENWWICFVKLQNQGQPTYFRGFEPVNYLDEIIIFECYEVTKDTLTNKWIKKSDGIF